MNEYEKQSLKMIFATVQAQQVDSVLMVLSEVLGKETDILTAKTVSILKNAALQVQEIKKAPS